MICALVTTTSGATSRKKYAAAPAPTAVASRIVSRLTAEALAVCARVRRVAGIVFFDIVTLKAFSAARASLGTKLHRWPGRARREVFAARSRLDSPCAGRFCLGVANETVTL